MASKLYVEPFVGEFGWELFCWQGGIRRMSKSFDETHVECRIGREMLYKDFATSISSYRGMVPENVNMWMNEGFVYEGPLRNCEVGDTQVMSSHHPEGVKPFIVYDWRQKRPSKGFKEQDFIKFGRTQQHKIDVLIHFRGVRHAGTDFKNYSHKKMHQLVDILRMRYSTVGFIGGIWDDFIRCAGVYDLRCIPLESLCDFMHDAKVVVGASSGPIHLASLCGTPTVTWYGAPCTEKHAVRHTHHWNPFHTTVGTIYNKDWNPDPLEIVEAIEQVTAKDSNDNN